VRGRGGQRTPGYGAQRQARITFICPGSSGGRESCLHSLHTLSNSYRLSAALRHSHSDPGRLYSEKKAPSARKARPVHIEKTILLLVSSGSQIELSRDHTRVLVTVTFCCLYHSNCLSVSAFWTNEQSVY